MTEWILDCLKTTGAWVGTFFLFEVALYISFRLASTAIYHSRNDVMARLIKQHLDTLKEKTPN